MEPLAEALEPEVRSYKEHLVFHLYHFELNNVLVSNNSVSFTGQFQIQLFIPNSTLISGRGSLRGRGGFPGRGRGRGRGRGAGRPAVTREQLDNQLDAYMSKTKGHLDAELDAYMAQADPESME